jgi:hypothetical protein
MSAVNKIILFSFICLLGIHSSELFADIVAREDGFDLLEDGYIEVDSEFGVLSNDLFEGTNLIAELKSSPENGSLIFESDGSFKYTPDPDFSGEDSFSYAFQSLPDVIEFEVSKSRSSVDFAATLTALGISQTRSDSSGLEGNLQVTLSPTESPFEKIHIEGGTLVLTDDVELNYRFLFVVTANVSADGGDLILNMTKPGPETTVSESGDFNQVDNEFQIVGTADISASLDLGVPDGPQSFDAILEDIDLTGRITESGQVLTLNVPVTFQGTFDVSGNIIDLDIEGVIVATAPKPSSEQSNVAEVILEIDPTNDAPDLIPDDFVVKGGLLEGNVLKNDSDVDGDLLSAQLENEPSKGTLSISSDGTFQYKQNAGSEGYDEFVYSVSNGGGNVSRELVTYESEWRYLDDGTDQGSSWSGVDFDDSSWSIGDGQLGYGEGDENTVISYGANSNNKHVTTYFRREFYLRDPDSVNSMVIGLVRNDACAVYLNGNEVFRDGNLNDDASYSTLSFTDLLEEDYRIYVAVPISFIRDGVNVISTEVHKSSRSSANFSFDLNVTAIIPPFTRIVSSGESWSYLDNGTYPGKDWGSLNYDDLSWKIAQSPLGYDEDSVVGDVGFGDNPDNKHTTTYFRKTFKFMGASEIVSSKIRIRKDDGVAVYLNGTEIVRDNLSTDANTSTFADSVIEGDDELQVKEYMVDSSLLLDGENVLSVEVHQANATSSDLFFDAEFFVSIAKIREFVTLDLADPVAGKDTDGDGWFDETEVFFGSSPTEPNSVPVFQLKSNILEDGQVQYMFPAEKGSGYVIQTSNDLQTWMTLKKLIVGFGNIATERFSASGKRHFYRIRKQ